MVGHVSELMAVAGGAVVVGVTSQILGTASTARKRLRHERDRIDRLLLETDSTPTSSATTPFRASASATQLGATDDRAEPVRNASQAAAIA